MPHLQAPWNLEGFAIQTIHLLDVERVRALIPSELNIFSVLPGKTVGGVYFSSYSAGTLQYNELIVVSAMIQHQGKLGGWVSHIYVDNPDSVEGGREIWGLPKELAQFTWDFAKHPAVRVSQGNELLCALNCQWQIPGWQIPLKFSAFSVQGAKLLRFEVEARCNPHLIGVELHIPPESPFAWLRIGQPILGVYANPFHLSVQAPSVVQERSNTFNYSS